MWRWIFILVVAYFIYLLVQQVELPDKYQVQRELDHAGESVEDSAAGRVVKDSVDAVKDAGKTLLP